MSEADFFLGGPIDPRTGSRLDGLTGVDPSDLTTHGVIVGMTGSGKTGLGIIYIEEALRRGIPTLVIDPKGDMTNLLLNPRRVRLGASPRVGEVERAAVGYRPRQGRCQTSGRRYPKRRTRG